jgi:hypothetical protein
MENNKEDIPAGIFNWMETRGFASLDAGEKKDVLAFLSESEYDALHKTAAGLRMVQRLGKAPRHSEIKANLLGAFDAKQPGKTKMKILPHVAVLWKIAAVFLLFASGWLFHFLIDYKNGPSSSLVAEIDTVYITRTIEPAIVKIFDTIYPGDEVQASPKKSYNKVTAKKTEGRDATLLVPQKKRSSAKSHDSTPEMIRENRDRDDSLAEDNRL